MRAQKRKERRRRKDEHAANREITFPMDKFKRPVGQGYLTCMPKPTQEVVDQLKREGCVHVTTIMTKAQQLARITVMVDRNGMGSTTIVTSANVDELANAKKDFIRSAADISKILMRGQYCAIHSAAVMLVQRGTVGDHHCRPGSTSHCDGRCHARTVSCSAC